MDTIDRFDQSERLTVAHTYTIRRCRRLGKPNPSRSRPVGVEFDRRADADAVYEYRYHLTGGIYVDRKFNLETENSRRILRPILRAARMKKHLGFLVNYAHLVTFILQSLHMMESNTTAVNK